MNFNNPQRQRPPGGPANGYGFQGAGWGGGPPQPFRPGYPPSRMNFQWGPNNPRQNFGSPGGPGFNPRMNFNNTAPPLPPEAPSSGNSDAEEKDVKNEIEPPAPGEDALASQRQSAASSTQQAGKIIGYPPPGYYPSSFPRSPWVPSSPYMPSYDQYQYNYNCVPPHFNLQQPTVSQPQQVNQPGSGKKKKKKKKGKNQEVIVQFGIVQPPLPPGPPPQSSMIGQPTASNPSAVRPPLGIGGGKTSRTEEFWPPSLREYVSKCYSMAQTDLEKDQVEIILKGKITKATQEGTISSKDWSQEPLPSLLGFKPPSAGKSGEGVKFNKFQIKGKTQLRARSPSFRRRRRSSSRSSSDSDSRSSSRRSRSPKPQSSNFVPLGSNRISPNGKLKRGGLGNREGRGRGGLAARGGRGVKRGGPSGLKVFDKSSKKRMKESDDCEVDTDGEGSVPYFWTHGKRPMRLDADLASTEKRNKRAARFADGSGGEASGPARKKTFNLLAQINTTLYQSDNFEENTTAWENLHIVGTCQDLEKRFLRLTSAPESHMVRPVYVLKKSLEMVVSKWKLKQDYHYTCDQLKSIRQDLTVQGIRDEFTIKVYETHARVALEKCDTTEFNQCQSQLKMLYHDIGGENRLEFTAYRILYYMYTKETLDLTSVMAELTDEDKKDLCIDHALKLRTAWSLQNFHRFFRLYLSSPKMSGYLIDWFVERERKSALRIYIKSYRPSLPVSVITRTLAFSSSEDWSKFVEPFGLVYSDVSRTTIDLKGSMACLPAIK